MISWDARGHGGAYRARGAGGGSARHQAGCRVNPEVVAIAVAIAVAIDALLSMQLINASMISVDPGLGLGVSGSTSGEADTLGAVIGQCLKCGQSWLMGFGWRLRLPAPGLWRCPPAPGSALSIEEPVWRPAAGREQRSPEMKESING
jgi:hypothetical protein